MDKSGFRFDGSVPKINNASEASKIGVTVIGIKCNKSVIIVAEKKSGNSLNINTEGNKIFRISETTGGGVSGLTADSRILINKLRDHMESHQFLHNSKLNIGILSKYIGHEIHFVKEKENVGPVQLKTLGVCIIIVGISINQPKLFLINPTCGANERQIAAIGSCAEEAQLIVKEGYRKNMSQKDLKFLALKTMKLLTEQKISPESLELGVISECNKNFRTLNDKELKKLAIKI
mmetsp:Transcript_44105/g.68957  ORF Transcript_44105/g.68957 Transcript_44105/m.68957 type:complete len:234 (-) Transcript_44105:1451-2152(-)